MPKRKAEVEIPTFPQRSRRAASKEALKQMQILLDDEEDDESETLEIPDDDDDVVPIEIPSPPKKKYKLSHRKSSDGNDREVLVLKTVSHKQHHPPPPETPPMPTVKDLNAENTLELDCWVEEISEAQIELKKKYDEECKALEDKIEALIKAANCTTVHKTELSSAYEISEPPPPPSPASNIILQPQTNASGQSYQLVMDPRLGLIVAGALPTNVVPTTPPSQPPPLTTTSAKNTFKGKVQISQAVKAVANATAIDNDLPVRQTRNRARITNSPSIPSPPVVSPVTRAQNMTRVQMASKVAATTPSKVTAMPASKVTPTPASKVTPSPASKVTPTPASKVTPTPASRVTSVAASKVTATAASKVTTTPTQKIVVQKPTSAPVTRLRATPSSSPAPSTANSNVRPTEGNVEGGLVAGSSTRHSAMVDLTEDRNQADSREVSFNKLQGKTYPSLVVVARPQMRVKDLNSDRSKLDTKVKSVLMHPPTKFTEWLIQQGLVRSEQKCSVHVSSQLKLGMYSDVSKFPYSGGYVWISECCPQRFVSVFSGSLFEGSPHPPIVILKLLYHWSCQTNIQNVIQWVKVDNLYVKGLYTWLRAVCTVAIHTHIKQLGGPGIKVEIGVISLGTMSQDGNKRQVTVEVLGILETTTKFIRLRAVEPDMDKNYKKRFTKILEPVMHWVHPSSTIVTDMTVDKNTLVAMGFTHVVQTTSTEYGNSNRMIMEYLRQVVPRMFQNTLSLLSRQIIQQFLDELVWREWFGTTAAQTFDNLITHLSEQTKAEVGSSLIFRLVKVAANPFKGWALSNSGNLAASKTSNGNNVNSTDNTPRRYSRVRKPAPASSPAPKAESPPPRPPKPVSPDVPEQMVPLENYYYGTIEPLPIQQQPEKVNLNMKCPFCKLTLNNNINLMHHLFKHAHNVSGDTKLCRYCLTGVPNNTDLMNHIATSHPSETKFDNGFVCLICETQFMNPFILGKHMSREHCPYELPYQCGSCSYRCSNHKQVIDHFYKCHSNGPAIQCPFCLKSTLLMSGGRHIVQNMNYFIQHLQKHQKKQIAKRCGKCNLWFIQKDLLKEHQAKMHISQRGKPRLVPWTPPRNCAMVPKSKVDEVPDDELIDYSSLHFSVTRNLICKECNSMLDSPKHLSSFESCTNTNCQYSTCCATAMKKHITDCKVLVGVLPKEPLPYIMFCICGFSSNDGNVLARHLAICEKKSAYPSRASANKAMVKQSMLDVLGLVRKPEETQVNEDKPAEKETVKKAVSNEDTQQNHKANKTVIKVDRGNKSTPDKESKETQSKETENKEGEVVIELDDEEMSKGRGHKDATSSDVETVKENPDEKKECSEENSKVQENKEVASSDVEVIEEIPHDKKDVGKESSKGKNYKKKASGDVEMSEEIPHGKKDVSEKSAKGKKYKKKASSDVEMTEEIPDVKKDVSEESSKVKNDKEKASSDVEMTEEIPDYKKDVSEESSKGKNDKEKVSSDAEMTEEIPDDKKDEEIADDKKDVSEESSKGKNDKEKASSDIEMSEEIPDDKKDVSEESPKGKNDNEKASSDVEMTEELSEDKKDDSDETSQKNEELSKRIDGPDSTDNADSLRDESSEEVEKAKENEEIPLEKSEKKSAEKFEESSTKEAEGSTETSKEISDCTATADTVSVSGSEYVSEEQLDRKNSEVDTDLQNSECISEDKVSDEEEEEGSDKLVDDEEEYSLNTDIESTQNIEAVNTEETRENEEKIQESAAESRQENVDKVLSDDDEKSIDQDLEDEALSGKEDSLLNENAAEDNGETTKEDEDRNSSDKEESALDEDMKQSHVKASQENEDIGLIDKEDSLLNDSAHQENNEDEISSDNEESLANEAKISQESEDKNLSDDEQSLLNEAAETTVIERQPNDSDSISDEVADEERNEKIEATSEATSEVSIKENMTNDFTNNLEGGGSAMEGSGDSVVSQSVLDTLAAECANAAKGSSYESLMDVDMEPPTKNSLEYNLVESETPMDTD